MNIYGVSVYLAAWLHIPTGYTGIYECVCICMYIGHPDSPLKVLCRSLYVWCTRIKKGISANHLVHNVGLSGHP